MSKSDLSKYKGSKKIFAELEPGDYTFVVVAKVPGVDQHTEALSIGFFEYQLYAVAADVLPNKVMQPASLNLLGLLGPKGDNFGQLVYLVPQTILGPQEHIELEFTLAARSDSQSGSPFLDVQAIDADGRGEQLDLRLVEVPPAKSKAKQESKSGEKADKDTAGASPGPEDHVEPKIQLKYPQSSRYQDDWEDGVSFIALASADIHHDVRYRVTLKNRDSAANVKASLKVLITEDTTTEGATDSNIHPESFQEIQRVKPKVPGLKESSFIQGSNAVMRTFQVASLAPFVPKSSVVYQSVF
jgi:hypothetical protein